MGKQEIKLSQLEEDLLNKQLARDGLESAWNAQLPQLQQKAGAVPIPHHNNDLSNLETDILGKQQNQNGMPTNNRELSGLEADLQAKYSVNVAVPGHNPKRDNALAQLEQAIQTKQPLAEGRVHAPHEGSSSLSSLDSTSETEFENDMTPHDAESLYRARIQARESAPKDEDSPEESNNQAIANQMAAFPGDASQYTSEVLEAELVSPKPVFEAKEVTVTTRGWLYKLQAAAVFAVLLIVGVSVGVTVGRNESPQPQEPTPTGTLWDLQETLHGQASDAFFGDGLAVNHNGTVVAVAASNAHGGTNSSRPFAGRVQVYQQYKEDEWRQMGQTFEGISEYTFLGERRSLAISGDGMTLVTGSSLHNFTGYATVHRYTQGQWIERGPALVGDVSGDLFAADLQVSWDGDTISVGIVAGGIGTQGMVKVYRWTGSRYEQLGESLKGKDATYSIGDMVALSSTGNRVVIGEFQHGPGEVRVYDWDVAAGSWNLVGEAIVGEQPEGRFGVNIACSDTCDTIAVLKLEGVDVFVQQGLEWKKKGETISVPLQGSIQVEISGDGDRVAVGVNNELNEGPGYVNVYDWVSSAGLPEAWTKTGRILGDERDLDFPTLTKLSGNGAVAFLSHRFASFVGEDGEWISEGGRVDIFEQPLR